MSKKYYPEINIYKGIGIILVVLGHALKQTGVMNMAFEIMLSVIYSFHMPLFFVASGFVSVKLLDFAKNEERITYIKSRAVRLLIPYFAVGIFYMPIKFVLSRFAVNPYDFSSAWKILIGENPNTVLWFLYTLFWISVICVFVLKRKNLKLIVLASAIVSFGGYLMNLQIEAPKYFFFFVAGIYLREHYEEVSRFITGKISGIIMSIFVAGNILLYISGMYMWTFFTAVSGCLAMLVFSQKMAASNQGYANKMLSVCGKYSMEIYILSDFIAIAFRILLWGILEINYIAVTVVCFLVGMLFPIPISKYIIQKVKIFKLLVLGMK